jgi:hypothetical protein
MGSNLEMCPCNKKQCSVLNPKIFDCLLILCFSIMISKLSCFGHEICQKILTCENFFDEYIISISFIYKPSRILLIPTNHAIYRATQILRSLVNTFPDTQCTNGLLRRAAAKKYTKKIMWPLQMIKTYGSFA